MLTPTMAHYWDAEHKVVSIADLKGRIAELTAAVNAAVASQKQKAMWAEELQWRKTQLAKLGG